MNIMMITNDTNFAWNLRREILETFVTFGHTVYLVSHIMGFKEEFKNLGIHLIEIDNDRRGTNPLNDLKLLLRYKEAINKYKPKIVFTNNIKPNIYAGLVCGYYKIRYIPNITGLGTPVENPGILQKLSIMLYKTGIHGANTIFFQNDANLQFMQEHHMLPKDALTVMLPGSGVNLESHPYLPWSDSESVHFLFAARILKEKGIDLFLAAARKYADENTVFDVCGQCDDPTYLDILNHEKSVRYHGLQKNLLSFYQQCSCFLYPSYYPEGMSNVLLEAAACGRPVISTDRAGCREMVDNGVTGFVVPVRNEQAVLDAVGRFLKLTKEERKQMGFLGRKKVEREFDRQIVIKKYVEEVNKA